MRDNVVQIDGMKGVQINEITFHKGVNEHGKATIKCTTDKKELKEIISDADGMAWVSIKIGEKEGEKATKTIFTGVIDTISLENCESLEKIKKVTVNLVGASYLLDIKKETRTFQNGDTKLSEIKANIKKNFENNIKKANIMINNGKGLNDSEQPESKMLIQYLETDYEFLKRVASMNNRPLITVAADSGDTNVSLNIGLMADGGSGSIETKIYKSEKNILSSLVAKKLGVENVSEKDYQMIEVRTREYFELGSKVSIDGKSLYVHSVDSMWGVKSKEDIVTWVESGDESNYSSSVFYHIYKLAEEKRFKVPQIYNEKMIGASLSAKVKEVKKEKLKITFACDVDSKGKPINVKEPKEFTFATVYTSQDGTGWYCMPEEDDDVRLYMPTEDESDVYVISAVHLEGGADRDNPDIKFMRNKFKKEIRFEEKKLQITNNNGMDIVIDDDKGIIIKSNKEISLSSKKDVTLLSKSGKMDLVGNKEVLLKQGGSASITLNSKVDFKAPNIKM